MEEHIWNSSTAEAGDNRAPSQKTKSTYSNNNNMNYLPYLMSQGANPEVAKQMMQSMMMSQMMPDMGGFGKF